ncbi:UNVERIFIED_CONTAM: hypothetical protein PYX00_002969 [Menopon gallinae]|uniref:Outer dense fiber protein 3-like protein 2 n=1 Tax=Menopon gallinae TaxID=328185 RepID=A0AAW2HZ06_9NEOP
MPPTKGYTFGLRLNDTFPKRSTTPSPLDYSPSCFNRFGKYTSPAYSIKSKGSTFENKNPTPSPVDYQSVNMFVKPKQSKSFPFGSKMQTNIKDSSTPTNQYSVPPRVTNHVSSRGDFSRPARSRSENQGLQKSSTPGPGAYDTVSLHLYKKKQPSATVTGRREAPFLPIDPQLPGPSQYDTLKCKIDMFKGTCAPRAPFGIRHSPKKFTVFTSDDMIH